MVKKLNDFNFAVGYYQEDGDGAVDVYRYGRDVHFGTNKDAASFLKYVQKQSPNENWKIFKLVEIPAK